MHGLSVLFEPCEDPYQSCWVQKFASPLHASFIDCQSEFWICIDFTKLMWCIMGYWRSSCVLCTSLLHLDPVYMKSLSFDAMHLLRIYIFLHFSSKILAWNYRNELHICNRTLPSIAVSIIMKWCVSTQVLVLTPTRELAIQVAKDFKDVTRKLSVTCFYGGSSYNPQSRLLIVIQLIFEMTLKTCVVQFSCDQEWEN